MYASFMNRYNRILQLIQSLNPTHIQLTDDSESHRGHGGYGESGESHFLLYLVSPEFRGLSRIDRQRKVNACLQSEFDSGLHALQMTLKSPEEV